LIDWLIDCDAKPGFFDDRQNCEISSAHRSTALSALDWNCKLRFYVPYVLCFSYLATWLPFLNKPIDWLIDWVHSSLETMVPRSQHCLYYQTIGRSQVLGSLFFGTRVQSPQSWRWIDATDQESLCFYD